MTRPHPMHGPNHFKLGIFSTNADDGIVASAQMADRAGLNVVCGWNPEEFALFGLPMGDDLYAQGLEWEAEDYYEHYAVTMAATASLDIYTASKSANSNSHEPAAYQQHRKRFAGGAGTYPLVSTPRHIAEEMVRISEVGFAGTTASFVNFTDGLPYFLENVLPLLVKAGLRS